MARINSNIPSLIAQANLSRTQGELGIRLERLSTGLKINRGKDDPAGLIISERIRSNIQSVETGVKNTERASAMLSTTEASLTEVNDLLNSIRSLMVESANTGANSQAERDANQLQIDSAIESITRISNTASFGSLKLLNGTLDYTLSGLRTSAVSIANVTNASFVGATSLQVEVDVTASAQVGALYYNGNTTPAGVIKTVSSNLSIGVGLPSQLNFSISQTAINIEGMNVDGTPNTYSIIASDRSGNPVPAGTSINFVTEGGQIESIRQTSLTAGIALSTAKYQKNNCSSSGILRIVST